MTVQVVCVSTFIGAGTLFLYVLRQRKRVGALEEALENAQAELEVLARERRSERAGRTKAERALRSLTLEHQALKSATAADEVTGPAAAPSLPEPATNPLNPRQGQVAYPLRPIGVLRSCFSGRNGTPRQPLLVETARAELELRPELSPDFFQGLEQFSHCWVLYIFHENTDLHRLWTAGDRGLRAKIAVPRLNGERLGALATRSPHRPCPLGLSVGRVLGVRGRRLVLGGLDVVNGSPVLDVKPYLPFCDAVSNATAPDWATRELPGDEPLAVTGVEFAPGAAAALNRAWTAASRRSTLYPDADAFAALVKDVLSRDIRSVTQRLLVPARHRAGASAALDLGPGAPTVAAEAQAGSAVEEKVETKEKPAAVSLHSPAVPLQAPSQATSCTDIQNEGYWRVVLEGVEVSYDIVANPNHAERPTVVVKGASVKRGDATSSSAF